MWTLVLITSTLLCGLMRGGAAIGGVAPCRSSSVAGWLLEGCYLIAPSTSLGLNLLIVAS